MFIGIPHLIKINVKQKLDEYRKQSEIPQSLC
jgi:hypothetical protein